MIRIAAAWRPSGSARAFRCTVHGLCFDNRYQLLDVIQAGDTLVLLREPDNAIGADAVRVQTIETAVVGYVPRTISRWLAPMMDDGFEPVAHVLQVRRGRPYYERLLIEVIAQEKDPLACSRGSS